jgi:hypothetical protein
MMIFKLCMNTNSERKKLGNGISNFIPNITLQFLKTIHGNHLHNLLGLKNFDPKRDSAVTEGGGSE